LSFDLLSVQARQGSVSRRRQLRTGTLRDRSQDATANLGGSLTGSRWELAGCFGTLWAAGMEEGAGRA